MYVCLAISQCVFVRFSLLLLFFVSLVSSSHHFLWKSFCGPALYLLCLRSLHLIVPVDWAILHPYIHWLVTLYLFCISVLLLSISFFYIPKPLFLFSSILISIHPSIIVCVQVCEKMMVMYNWKPLKGAAGGWRAELAALRFKQHFLKHNNNIRRTGWPLCILVITIATTYWQIQIETLSS